MKTKVSDLEGENLAEWVARAQGWGLCEMLLEGELILFWKRDRNAEDYNGIWAHDYRPDINGVQAMELQKKLSVAVLPPELTELGLWAAGTWKHYSGKIDNRHELGETPEIAICRAVVSSVFGEYVEP